MKTVLQGLSGILFLAALIFGYRNHVGLFFMFLSVSLGLFSLTETRVEWGRKITKRNWKDLLKERWQMTLVAKICQFASFLCLIAYVFIFPVN